MHRLHRAWLVAAAGFVALLAAAAIRATFGILMEPLMDEFGWSHGAIATAASINLVVFGLSRAVRGGAHRALRPHAASSSRRCRLIVAQRRWRSRR